MRFLRTRMVTLGRPGRALGVLLAVAASCVGGYVAAGAAGRPSALNPSARETLDKHVVAVAAAAGDGSAVAGVSDGWLNGATVAVGFGSGDVSARGVGVAVTSGVDVGIDAGFSLAVATGFRTVRGLCCSAISVSPRLGSSAAKSKLFFSPTRSTKVRTAATSALP